MVVSNKHAIAETYLECAKIAREKASREFYAGHWINKGSRDHLLHAAIQTAINQLVAQFEERAIKTREGIPLD